MINIEAQGCFIPGQFAQDNYSAPKPWEERFNRQPKGRLHKSPRNMRLVIKSVSQDNIQIVNKYPFQKSDNKVGLSVRYAKIGGYKR